MSYTIGSITVPTIASSGQTFPLKSDYNLTTTLPYSVTSHRFGGLAEKSYQNFLVGEGNVKYGFVKKGLSYANRQALLAFFESLNGVQSFVYDVPLPEGGTSAQTVIFENQPITLDQLVNSCSTGFTFLDITNTVNTTYSATATCLRFPSTALATALTAQVQQIVPLIHIKVKDPSYPEIWLSDQSVTIEDGSGSGAVQTAMGWGSNSQFYAPRILGLGEPGSDVVFSQTLSSEQANGDAADSFSFQLANGDRVMSAVANSTDLKYASIDLCLYHVQSSTILQLVKGFIQSYTINGTEIFTVQCNDGLYPVYQQYPTRVVSRFCQNVFDDGNTCPYSVLGSSRPNSVPMVAGGTASTYTSFAGTSTVNVANPNLCSFLYDDPYDADNPTVSPGGCIQHGMYQYFTGVPLIPQSVQIHDLGNHRDLVTSTSIMSNTAVGQVLPEIYCNQGATGLNAFVADGIMAAIRDESSFLTGLALFGVGPMGSTDPTVANAYTIIDRVVQSGGANDVGPWVTSTNTKTNGYQGNAAEFLANANGNEIYIGPTLDGFNAYGFTESINGNGQVKTTTNNTNGGLRQVWGWHPIPTTDEGWNQCDLTQVTGGSGSITTAGNYANGPMQFSAGAVFAEIRIQKPTGQGISPTAAETHSMTAPFAQGIAGWTWDYTGGTRTLTTLTNPYWVAVNTFLRALGLFNADSATQQDTFVLSSLIQSTALGGTAQIADDSVPTLVGTGNETQFQFQGILDTQKPYKQWLQEILNTALGFYTWEFGRLKLGCRINATPTVAFTVGNTLYQSLSLSPIDAAFEREQISFGNVALQFQADQAEVWDRTHSTFYGRSTSPLTQRVNRVGVSTMSQALRLALTDVFESEGGQTQAEWGAARKASWATTIMALDTEVGQVVSLGSPTEPMADVPGGYADFRITSWKLMRDWSIAITAKTVTASMYAYDTGPVVSAVVPPPLLIVPYNLQFVGEWAPYQIQAAASDALFPNEWTFDAQEVYYNGADNTATAFIAATGAQPINNYIADCPPPVIYTAKITQSTTGGSILPGLYKISVCATNSVGQCSPPSEIVLVNVPEGTNTNSIELSGILWPAFVGLSGYVLFCSNADDLICAQVFDTLTAGTPAYSYTPTSITFNGPVQRSTWALPNANNRGVQLLGRIGIHFGVLGAQVNSVSTNTIVSGETIDVSGVDNWAGRVLMMSGRMGGSIPFANFNITAFDAATGTFTLDRDPTGIVQFGDVFDVCFKGYDNSADPTVFTDTGISNATNVTEGFPSGGFVIGTGAGNGINGGAGEVGHEFRVYAGTSRGQSARIVSNTHTSVTLDAPIVLDATSIVMIVAPTWTDQSTVAAVNNSVFNNPTTLTMLTTNYIYQSLLVGAQVIDTSSQTSPDADMPVRPCYVFGQGGLTRRIVTANTTLQLTDGILLCDTTAGNITVQFLSAKIVPGRKFVVTKISSDSNTVTLLPASGETLNGLTSYVLTGAFQSEEVLMDVS